MARRSGGMRPQPYVSGSRLPGEGAGCGLRSPRDVGGEPSALNGGLGRAGAYRADAPHLSPWLVRGSRTLSVPPRSPVRGFFLRFNCSM